MRLDLEFLVAQNLAVRDSLTVSGPLSAFLVSGDCSGGEIPVPIPNTVVKPSSADDTAWESVWESRSSPDFSPPEKGAFSFRFF